MKDVILSMATLEPSSQHFLCQCAGLFQPITRCAPAQMNTFPLYHHASSLCRDHSPTCLVTTITPIHKISPRRLLTSPACKKTRRLPFLIVCAPCIASAPGASPSASGFASHHKHLSPSCARR